VGKLRDYDPRSIMIRWGGTNLNQGIASGTFITVARNGPTWRHLKGSDGEAARSRTNDFGGRVDFTLSKQSLTNTLLSAQLQADEITGLIVFPFGLVDINGLTVWSSPLAYLEGWPEDSYGTEEINRNWSLICDPLIPFPGGGLFSA
jgi:hypothetical protein